MYALSSHEGPVESIFNFIQNPLGVLCAGGTVSTQANKGKYSLGLKMLVFLDLKLTYGSFAPPWAMKMYSISMESSKPYCKRITTQECNSTFLKG